METSRLWRSLFEQTEKSYEKTRPTTTYPALSNKWASGEVESEALLLPYEGKGAVSAKSKWEN